ncbi:MAG: DUF4279 domain-containing protein [Alphaproteobacteria bacterium]|nr:DUF4279 domain-containing protein [Alphaproteobacteria bacterium]
MVAASGHYKLLLRFFHPTMDMQDVSRLLNLKPNYYWNAGEPAKSPTGRILNFKRRNSYWSYEVDAEDTAFSKSIKELLDLILPHKSFLEKFVSEGGRVNFYLQLSGLVNVGDTLSFNLLSKMAELKIELDVEVFPDWAVIEAHNKDDEQ